ncbi:MAG: methyltransferase domain-containing protein [candidate division WOR-3 bacterium]
MEVKLRPFEQFAFYYDSFMTEVVNYKQWINYILEIWRREKKEVKTVLDLACGTGIPTFLLLEKGYAVTGLDSSPEMLSVLKKKLGKRNWVEGKLKIVLADMKNFRLVEKFDAVVSLYDSINYLLTEEDLKSCFHSVFFALKEGGIFTFDINTIFCLEEIWDNQSFWRESKELLTFWQNEYDKEKRISTLYLKCWVKGPNRTYLATFEETHQERGYELEKIRELLKAVGFSEVKFYHHLTFEKPYPETSRVMVVAIKR